MLVYLLIQACTKGDRVVTFCQIGMNINEKDVLLIVLGDPTYPLLPWLMKAYPNNGHLTCEQKQFSYRLSKARVVFEHGYGHLKGRWKCLSGWMWMLVM